MQQFEHMSAESSRFYTILINELLLNVYAVQKAVYNKHISRMKTTEEFREWRKVLPKVLEEYAKQI